MKHAKRFSILVFVAVLGYGAVGFYFLPLATFHGELTRMALLPESHFGWTKPQPAIEKKWMQQSTMETADVLVIGDSFSDSRVWQSVLTQRGLKVRTESWDSVRGICEDFLSWVREHGFKGRHIVLESIERNLADDIRKSVVCKHMHYHPNPRTESPRRPPVVSFNIHSGNYSGKLSTGIQTKLNETEYEQRQTAPGFKKWKLPNEVTLVRIPGGCQMFSHARCMDALFYDLDKPEDIADKNLEFIAVINQRLKGVNVVWAFVPNKSTAYLYPEKQFWNKAAQRFNAPNLLAMTQQAQRDGVIDLYPANGTHFSTTGYLLMGEQISARIK